MFNFFFILFNILSHLFIFLICIYFLGLFSSYFILQKIILIYFWLYIEWSFCLVLIFSFFLQTPVNTLLFILCCFILFAVFFFQLGLELVLFIFIILYIGALMILFLFILMLFNMQIQNKKQQNFIIFFVVFLFVLKFWDITTILLFESVISPWTQIAPIDFASLFFLVGVVLNGQLVLKTLFCLNKEGIFIFILLFVLLFALITAIRAALFTKIIF